MTDSFSELRAAAVDERAHNFYYRQAQLERLIQAVLHNVPEIREAIATDYGHTTGETAIELHLTLAALKRDYASVQPAKAYDEEYRIFAGKDAATNRKPFGIVYIEPCAHTLLYSILVPLSAAIAAGNCVIVLLEQNLRVLPGLLREVLNSALQPDTFAIASSPIRDQAFLNILLHVNQNSNEQWPRASQVASPSSDRSVAIVDRTADVQTAAKELVTTRFTFGGQSPYAPDLVLVNEFVKQAFLQAVISECAALGSGVDLTSSEKPRSLRDSRVKGAIDSIAKADADHRVLLQEQRMAVVDLLSRKEELLSGKMTAPVLFVHGVRSLDDAVDLVSSTAVGPALSAYHFSNAATGKYLAQFVDARASFINQIPRQLLVGPAFPTATHFDIDVRYPVDLFSVARPAFQRPSVASQTLAAAVSSPKALKDAATEKLMTEATAPLKIMKRHPGGGVGFFEQGILISFSIILTTIVGATGTGMFWVVKNRKLFW